MLTSPLYWWERFQSCRAVAGADWRTLLLVEKVTLNRATAKENENKHNNKHILMQICDFLLRRTTFNSVLFTVLTLHCKVKSLQFNKEI